VWRKILDQASGRPSILAQSDATPAMRTMRSGYGLGRVGDACQELAQMDPPRFATIGLFLLAYLIVLVPVNYLVLKQRDKKEYAWLTTPGIVLVFSLLAYFIGFGMKGGRVLLAKVGVVEAAAGSPVGAAQHYVGLFSPRKTEYEIAALDPGVTLADWRSDTRSPQRPIRFIQSDPFRAEAVPVNMWSMRILRAENVVPLGQGVEARFTRSGATWTGTVVNRTPYPLQDCRVILGAQSHALGDLAPGASRSVPPIGSQSMTFRSVLPSSLLTTITGNRPIDRMKRAILTPLTSYNPTAGGGNEPQLIAWITQPLVKTTVDGRSVQEQNVNLLFVHL
jgi:hypothetical protein